MLWISLNPVITAKHQLKSRHYGETVQNLRLIRAAMVISPKDRNLADFRVLEDDTNKKEL